MPVTKFEDLTEEEISESLDTDFGRDGETYGDIDALNTLKEVTIPGAKKAALPTLKSTNETPFLILSILIVLAVIAYWYFGIRKK